MIKKNTQTLWKILALLVIVFKHRAKSDSSVIIGEYDMVHFNLVYGNMSYTRYYVGDYLKLFSDENFLFNRKTVFYVHGWIEDFTSESVQTIVSAYLQRDDHNIIVIDWGQYSFGFYYTVIPRFTAIAKIFARIMLDLFERGLDINTVHLVGHSFGSQFMGIAGRELQKVSMGKYKIKRISGLDPAHYGFFPSPTLENPLSSTDAEFVDSIHSDVTFIGTPYHTGQVNFYPNDGKLQPGCPSYSFRSYMQLVNSFCSHNHGWRYWAETLKPGKEQIFPAVLCKDYKDFIEDKCNENPINFMGYGATPSINDNSTGSYYIRLRSNVNFTVDDSYYLFLSTSLNYRSDLVRIVARLRQFFNQLSRN